MTRLVENAKQIYSLATAANFADYPIRSKGSSPFFLAKPRIDEIATPLTSWQKTVDQIEAPFAPEYDKDEYGANPALNMMGGCELRMMLNSMGLKIGLQPDIEQLYAQQPLKGARLLDIGCGPGRITTLLAALGANVVSIDATKEYLDVTAEKLVKASKKLGQDLTKKATLIQCPAESFAYTADGYDGIVALFGVLNHVENGLNLLPRIYRSIKPGGSFTSSFYGSNDALIFKLLKQNVINYAPSILVRRVNGGIALGENTSEILPAAFPYPAEIRSALKDSLFRITNQVGFLRLASLYPKSQKPKDVDAFIDLTERVINPRIRQWLEPYKYDPVKLLVRTIEYDLLKASQSQINEFAYFAVTATKV